MIVCDRAYLKELERRMKDARRKLPKEVANGIDAEIEAIEAQGDPRYSTRVISTAFRVHTRTLGYRTHPRSQSATNGKPGCDFQGHLPCLPLNGTNGDPICGTWFDAAAVNIDTQFYRTWRTPDELIRALELSH